MNAWEFSDGEVNDFVQVLLDYRKNTAVKNYLRELDRPNSWTVMSYRHKSYEACYSKILSLLLDSNENHGLGRDLAEIPVYEEL